MSVEDQADEVLELVGKIESIVASCPAAVLSAALADVTASWLVGHQDPVNPNNPELLAMREKLFANFCMTVRHLVAIKSGAIREPRGRA